MGKGRQDSCRPPRRSDLKLWLCLVLRVRHLFGLGQARVGFHVAICIARVVRIRLVVCLLPPKRDFLAIESRGIKPPTQSGSTVALASFSSSMPTHAHSDLHQSEQLLDSLFFP